MIFASHEPFLQSKAQMLIMPVSTDGNIAHPVIARCKGLYADNYEHYQKKAIGGELSLGDAMVFRISKQTTGLGVQMGGAEYVGSLVIQKFPEQPISVRMLTRSLTALKPHVYELMRYKGLRRVAILGSALLVKNATAQEGGTVEWLTAEHIMNVCQDVLGDVPKLTVEVHFGRDIPLSFAKNA
ncbi:hypothetical protein [Moraxella caprae]|nr:hypothetical protein [Moraxella caprae]